MKFPTSATITEVGPRDGLQAFPRVVSVTDKVWMIERLVCAGLHSIEVTAFVHPAAVPQMADAKQVFAAVKSIPGAALRALVPNLRGAQRAADAGVHTVIASIIATESYSQRNHNKSVREVLCETKKVLEFGSRHGIAVEPALGTVFSDPYEGYTPPKAVTSLVEQLVDAGATTIHLGDTAGVANPRQVNELCGRLADSWPNLRLGLHLHDANGMVMANVLAALDAGVRLFDSAICGMGGGIALPRGSEETGNVATEDLALLFSEMGIDTGLIAADVAQCAADIEKFLGIRSRSRLTAFPPKST